MPVSGLTSSADNLIISGALMFIDDDTMASAVIGGEKLQFSAELAKLMAGKGAKVQVASALKSFGVAMAFDLYEITGTAMGILFGQNVVTESGYTKWRIKNKPVAPSAHKFKFTISSHANKDIDLIFWRAKNENFGELPFDGQDFTKASCLIKPEPLNPSDPNEVTFEMVWKN